MKFKSYNFENNILNAIDVTKKQSNYLLKYSSNAIENQKRLFNELGILDLFDNRIVVSTPFSYKINRVDDKSFRGYSGKSSNCNKFDGVILSEKNVPLLVGFGDCPQLMIIGDKEIGILHATRDTINMNIIIKFFEEFSKTNNLIKTRIGFSPYLFQENFENEFLPRNRKKLFEKHSVKRDKKHYINLKEMIIEDLLSCGILKKNISDFEINTYEMSKISSKLGGFEISHVQSKMKEGRGAMVLMRK